MLRISQSFLFAIGVGVFSLSNLLAGEVISSAPNGFTLKYAVEIKASPQKVYGAVVSAVGKWWNPAHTYTGDSENLSIEAKPGGCFCENWGTGSGVQHLEVVYADAGKLLRMTGGLGPLQALGVFGSMTWTFTEAGGGTRLEVVYNVTGYDKQGLAQWATPVDGVLNEQATRLKRYIETGNPEDR